MIHIETVIYIIAYTILAIFFIYLWVDSIGDKKREEYLERIAILKRAINKSKKKKWRIETDYLSYTVQVLAEISIFRLWLYLF